MRERTRLFLYHKQRGLLTTHADPGGRPTIFSVLPKDLPRLISVGRLDLNTEGLLLLTNDGGLARALELPATGWLRRYRVRAHGRVAQAQLDALRRGITIDGVRYGEIEATVDRAQGSNVWLTFAIREGKNREVKNVLGHLGLAVNRLIRVSFGPFRLGDLPEGAIEEVKTRTLRDQLGDRIAALAGADFSGPRIERKAAAVSAPHRNARGGRAGRSPKADGTFRAGLPRRSGSPAASGSSRAQASAAHAQESPRAMPSASVSRNSRGGKKRRAAAGPRRARGADAHRRRAFARPPARGPDVAGDQADRRPAARIAVQHSRPCLWRSDRRRARARSVCGHRRARARGAVPRRRLCAVHRRGSGGTRAAARERGDAGIRRRHPYLSARCHQARGGASDRGVLAGLP